MNRRKKLINKLVKKSKQARAKKQPKPKNRYISKADREPEAPPQTEQEEQ
ncbi:MAG: DUF2986 domain-containing protein [Thiomicrorhabdus sp.]|nr:DUF2986 domain-containing protein [Thiomicrorhabdus sp.]